MATYISQSFIFIGYFIFFVSRFGKNKKSILVTDNISRACFVAGYVFLRSANGIEHTMYGMVRNLVGQFLIEKKKRYKIIGFLIMTVLLCIMYSFSFNGISTIMLILSGLINLFMIIFATEQGIRLGTAFAAICNIISFLIIGSYMSVLGELLCIIVSVVSFVKECKNVKNI